jgi:hypothetical protein
MELRGLFDENKLLGIIKDFSQEWYYFDSNKLTIENHDILRMSESERIICLSEDGRFLISASNLLQGHKNEWGNRPVYASSLTVRTLDLSKSKIKIIETKNIRLINQMDADDLDNIKINNNIIYCLSEFVLIIYDIDTQLKYEKRLKYGFSNVVYKNGQYICYGIVYDDFIFCIIDLNGNTQTFRCNNVMNYQLSLDSDKFYILQGNKVSCIDFTGTISFIVKLDYQIDNDNNDRPFEVTEGLDLISSSEIFEHHIIKLYVTDKYIILQNVKIYEDSYIFNSKTGASIDSYLNMDKINANNNKYLLTRTNSEVTLYKSFKPLTKEILFEGYISGLGFISQS